MNQFGGDWTSKKIDILSKYAKAYLSIMHSFAKKFNWKTMYFDGFAGSGFIESENFESIEGAALKILSIDQPMPFDMYYFVEFDVSNASKLMKNIKEMYPEKKAYVSSDDCNYKIKALANFLSNKGKNYKVLAFIDPYGMQVNWDSIEALKNCPVDLWILVPTGIGVNRMLKNDGKISDAWLKKLEDFLGISAEEIQKHFYKEKVSDTLFGPISRTKKEENAAEKAAELYRTRLGSIFKYVSKSFIMKNSANSIMYHFIMASNNKNAIKIANEVVDSK